MLFIVLFAFVVIYYYVKVLNKPLPGISNVYAQTTESLSQKKTLSNFPEIKNNVGVLSLIYSKKGVEIKSLLFSPPDNCNLNISTLEKLQIILADKNIKIWNDYLQKCNKESVSFKKKNITSNEFIFFKNKIIDIIKGNKVITNFDLIKIYNSSQGLNSSFYKSMIKILIGLKTNNLAWVKKEVRTLLLTPPELFFFDISNIESDSSKNQDFLWQQVISILNFMIKKLGDETIIKMLVNFLYQLTEDSNIKDLMDKNNLELSLSEIREMSHSINYGTKYLGLWYYMFFKRSVLLESKAYLEKNSKTLLDNLNRNNVWLIKNRMIMDKRDIKLVRKILKNLRDSDLPYYRYLYISLLSDKSFKKVVFEGSDFKNKPYFQELRKFSNDLLKSGRLKYFSIYSLLYLGDFKDELIEKIAQEEPVSEQRNRNLPN